MAGQIEFMDMIHELERIAETNGKQLSMDEIRNYFMDMNLDQTQFDFICKYYEAHGITIANRVEKMEEEILDEEIETREDPLDAEMVAIYEQEAAGARPLTPEEMEELAEKVLDGDEEARTRLIEGNLSFAMNIAKKYKKMGLQLSDLIQEGNIGLMMAVGVYEPGKHDSFRDFAEGEIHRHMKETIEEYNSSTRSAMKMANKVNELNDIATAFAKEHDREAKPEELAERMGISEEEVRDLMKVSLDAISVIDDSKLGK